MKTIYNSCLGNLACLVKRAKPEDAFFLFLLMVAVIAMLITAPHEGDFWWSDAPRHALNGAFLMDFIQDFPINDPIGYAENYYAQYPALSILFYPPLFPIIEAAFNAVLNVSHLSAQITVTFFWIVLVVGAFKIVRNSLPSTQAFAVVLLFMSFHEVAFWGRQVMLEIPVYASMVLSVLMLIKYLDTSKAIHFYGITFFLLCAVYTKQTAIFLGIAIGLMLLIETKGNVLKRKHVVVGCILAVLALLPLAFLTVKFGQINVNAMAGETGQELSRMSFLNWVYYSTQLPSQVGWPVLILALFYLIGRLFKSTWSFKSAVEQIFALWILCGYLFFSMIALKEPRHSVIILLPLAFFAITAINRVFPLKVATIISLGFAVLSFAYTMIIDKVPQIKGYNEAANYVAAYAPKNSMVLFSGYRDGSFIFNMRTHEERRDLGVLRSDKLLLKVKVKRELGLEQKRLTRASVASMLNRYGVSYIVNQSNFWDDLEAMQMFQELLHTSQFSKVAEVRVTGNVPHQDKVLEIYRNLEYTLDKKERPALELLMIDQVI